MPNVTVDLLKETLQLTMDCSHALDALFRNRVKQETPKIWLEQAALIACSAHTIITASSLGESPVVVTSSKQ